MGRVISVHYDVPIGLIPFVFLPCIYCTPLAGEAAVSPALPQYPWKRRESGPSREYCQVSSEDDGFTLTRRDLETKGHTIGSHITLLRALFPLPEEARATNYVIRGARGGVYSRRFLHTKWSADHGKTTDPLDKVT